MINMFEVNETNKMITQENLDVRTITLGISLLDCVDADLEVLNETIYRKITTVAKDLVATGQQIEREYGIPIVNKRISITPIAFVGGKACKCPEDYVSIAKTLDRAAKEVGVNFIGGYSALVSNSGSTLCYRACLQFRQRRLHKMRYQHGCGTPDGQDRKTGSRIYKRAGFSWLCKAGCILQCTG